MSNHVSTLNPTSIKAMACIDKLSFSFPKGLLPVQELLDRAGYRGIHATEERLKSRWCYKISSDPYHFFVSKPADLMEQQSMTRIITNPSRFDSYGQYRDFINLLFTEVELSLAKVSRLDLTVDYLIPFETIFRGLDCKYKIRASRFVADIEYKTEGSLVTGVNIGRGNEKFVVYNHQRKHRGSSYRTRIECQLSGKKCPIRNYLEITELARKLNDKNPFDLISLNQIHMNSKDEFHSISHQKKITGLSSSIDCLGYLGARKKLNKNKNFKRDYQKYFYIQPLSQQPNKVIESYILNYFNQC